MRRSSGAVTTIGARMDRTLLLTGFPGFIGTRLATRLLADDPTAQLVALVEPRMVARAREVAAAMEASERIEVVAGDITDSRLGLDGTDHARLRRQVTQVFHLAAVYDLAVPADGESLRGPYPVASSVRGRHNPIGAKYNRGTPLGCVAPSAANRWQ